MADNDILTADIHKQGRGDFSGEGALRLRITVLRCQLDVATGDCFGDLVKGSKDGGYDDFHDLIGSHGRYELGDQSA
jgi:hypothetical protein